MKPWVKVLMVVAGAIPLLGLVKNPPDFMLLIYTFFVVAYLARKPYANLISKWKWPLGFKFWILTVLSGFLAEVLAWGGHFAANSKEPALLHPQLFADLILGFGFYSGWAIAWLIASRVGKTSLQGVFITTGILGVFFEQMGAIFKQMISVFLVNPFISIMLGVFVFAVYGSIMGLAYLPLEGQFKEGSRKGTYVVAIILMFFCAVILTSLAGLLPFLPPKQPIGAHPFW